MSFSEAKFGHIDCRNLTGAGLKGPISPAIGQLVDLESLILESNSITDPIPVEIGNLVHLTTLNMILNNLTSIPPDALLKCNLTHLSVTFLLEFWFLFIYIGQASSFQN